MLLVCGTCPRHDPRRSGAFARAVLAALAGSGAEVRKVACLGGCPHDGVAAVDGPNKTRVRWSRLDASDADDLLTCEQRHRESDTGEPEDWVGGDQLAHRVSALTRKRQPA